MLKYAADLKTLLYIVITSCLFAFLWFDGMSAQPLVALWSPLHILLYIWLLFMSVTVSVMAHNQMHVPIWKSRVLNVITELWITCFYGFPVFAWIPTHNRNHHRYTNKEPDNTRTYRFSEENNFWTIVTYPSISGSVQMWAIKEYLKERWKLNKQDFLYCMVQITVLISWYALFFYINWFFALIYVVIAHQVALYVVMFFNYIQHVHADEESEYNHSRNITGSLNFFLFNNGLHTAHHMNANLHWSKLREAHRKIESHIDPSLNEKSFWGYLLKAYILSVFIPKFKTKSLRLKRISTSS
jgi:beta-carotene hydroxylase